MPPGQLTEEVHQRGLKAVREFVYQHRVGHFQVECQILDGDREMGVGVTPIMFPAVPLGSARLRLCVTAAHRTEDLEFALDCFKRLRA